MSRAPIPAWVDDLEGSLAAAWDMLVRGAADRRSPCHHPVIGTVGLDGRPRQRVMILRASDPKTRSLRLHTDLRSEKVAEIKADPRVSLLVYDPGFKAQIRLDGHATLHADDGIAEEAWAQSQLMSRACYGTMPAPGSDIAEAGGFSVPFAHDADAVAKGRTHFAALVIHVEQLEWLYLAHERHRRARYAWDAGGTLSACWLVP